MEITQEQKARQMLQVLKLVGKRPCTAGQLTERAKGKLSRYQISRRLPELERLGRIERTNRAICPVVGSMMYMWKLVE